MTKHLINEKYDVEEAEASRGFGKGDKREDYADAWKNTGNVILVGLPGSGKQHLAASLSERTGLEVVVPSRPEQAVEVLGGQEAIIILDDTLVEDESVQPLIHGAGKVFYLMANSNALSVHVAGDGSEEERERVWRDLSARLGVMEPVFYSVLHFIIQAGQEPEAVLEDALEKIAF